MRQYIEATMRQDCEAEMKYMSERSLRDWPLEDWIAACNAKFASSPDDEISYWRNSRITEVRTLDEGREDGSQWALVRIITTGPDDNDRSYTERVFQENGRWVLFVSPTGEDIIRDMFPRTPDGNTPSM